MDAYMFVTGLLAFIFIFLIVIKGFFEGDLGGCGVIFCMLLMCWAWPLLVLYLLYRGVRLVFDTMPDMP